MWYEYQLMSEEEALVYFGEEYENALQFYTEQATGNKVKVFTKRKGLDIFQHKHYNSFVKLKNYADNNLIKYDDFWEFGFDFIRAHGSIKLYGVTTFCAKYIMAAIYNKDYEKYKDSLKMATSSYFNARYYNPDKQIFIDYYNYIIGQVYSKYPTKYLMVFKDLILSSKIHIDFIKVYFPDLYSQLFNRYWRVLDANR